MLTLVLTRHGATDRSDPEQHLGQRVDIPLSEAGAAAARALADRLAEVRFARVLASPLRRAQETALAVTGGAAVETDARLLEMDYGSWEGLTYQEIERTDGPARRAWEAEPAELACPGGESGNDVAARVRSLLGDLIADGRDQTVVAVAHSTTNRVLLCVALGVPIRDYRRRFRQDPANVTVLRFDGPVDHGARLLLANDMSHVRGVRGATWS